MSGAMRMQGSGVSALGFAMEGPVAAKYRIKRVGCFLGNAQVEIDAVNEAIFHQFRPRTGPVVVLADWTDRHPFQQLVLALPRNGRTRTEGRSRGFESRLLYLRYTLDLESEHVAEYILQIRERRRSRVVLMT